MNRQIDILDEVDDLNLLLKLLPKHLYEWIRKQPDFLDIVEVIMDLGASAEIRFQNSFKRVEELGDVSQLDIDHVCQGIGKFNTDNRAGIERTLHRISAIRNREGKIIGLTCRLGRAVVGTIQPIRDLLDADYNILFLGPPGIGKTTKLRETAREFSDYYKKRVVVVDTSNEIAGDGDIPHKGIGAARRMQVPSPDLQHAVMIEAVENHTPEVIIVDEIGTEMEAAAARTIAERGVQLVATAHGHSLENLINNPTLCDLVGGIQTVILGDEEAKFRGTSKTVLERQHAPTFDVLIEIRERDVFAIYKDLAKAVDLFLSGETMVPELRRREKDGLVSVSDDVDTSEEDQTRVMQVDTHEDVISIYPYGINSDRLYAVIHEMQLPVMIATSIHDADLVLTVQSQMVAKSKVSQLLQGKSLPLHVIDRNSSAQIRKFFRGYFHLTDTDDDIQREAIREIEKLCKKVVSERKIHEGSARSAALRRIQHGIVEELGLNSMSIGEEPNRRVRVYPPLES